ncbi:MAG: TRAP transporter substrate-binding protein [Deltaproteobacteria bacterium]|nr:TRAP transporter substrate-binding protein [Deltaproteobacteria bacterium]
MVVRSGKAQARRRFTLHVAAAAAGALLLAVSSGSALAAAKYELSYATFFPATHAHTALATEWAKEVEKRTKGVVKINIFPGATLTPPDQTYDSVTKGIADIGMSVASYSKGRFPLSEVIDLPLGYTSGIQATRLANAYYQKFQPKEFADSKMMYVMAYGPGVFHTKKPIGKLEDLKGLKIRCTGTSAKVVAALGATPVAMPMTETYDAIQKGVVEGYVAPQESLKGFKMGEVVSNTTQNFGSSFSLFFFIAMNKQKWDSLPKDVQATIEKVNQEWIDKSGRVWDQIEKEGFEFAHSKGVKVVRLSKAEDVRWAETVKPIITDYVANTKAKGLPGEEALKFCQEWLKKNPT